MKIQTNEWLNQSQIWNKMWEQYFKTYKINFELLVNHPTYSSVSRMFLNHRVCSCDETIILVVYQVESKLVKTSV